MNRDEFSFHNLTTLYRQSGVRELSDEDRYVVFSDLHLGDGRKYDDFLYNSDMVLASLRNYYLRKGFGLILNGDIEELQRYRFGEIRRRWSEFYDITDEFRRNTSLDRLVGNHDVSIVNVDEAKHEVVDGLRFNYRGQTLFVFHGHQTSLYFEKYNHWVTRALRIFANPLRIQNYSVSHNSAKRFKTEERVYDFSSRRKLLSIIGHTHRPLFESMSKTDSIKFEIERLCRKYPKSSPEKQANYAKRIQDLRKELDHVSRTAPEDEEVSSLYNTNHVVPCVFNSGCTLGKRGVTCLEIKNGKLALVHWFDHNRSRKYLQYANLKAKQLDETNFFRVVIKRDNLDYIFTRIRLLA